MTALLAPRQQPGWNRPDLKPVPGRRRQLGMPGFIAVVVLILGVGMVGVLVLTTMLQGQAFEVERKQSEAAALSNRVSDLQAELASASSVHNLGVLAQRIGMKPNPYPVQLRLPDGKVIGKPTEVMGGEIPSVRYVTEAQAAAELQARHAAEARKKAEAEAKKKAAAEAKAQKKAEADAAKNPQTPATTAGTTTTKKPAEGDQ